MDIKIGTQFRITTDSYNFILRELVPPSEKSKTGQATWGKEKYYTKLESALKAVLRHDLLHSDATDIGMLQADLVRCERMIEGIARELSE